MNFVLTNNGIQCDTAYLRTSLPSDCSVYEVIRVIDGVALFLEDHFSRLKKSLNIQHLNLQLSYTEFKTHIAELVKQNQRQEGNVKFICATNDSSLQWAFSFIQHSYPDARDYDQGISTDFLFAERQNPNAKVIQSGIRDRANQLIADQNLYEVLLVDRDGLITEGSRSNVFFVKSGVFYTAPASMVLEGITRQKTVECLKRLNFSIVEKAVAIESLGTFDSAFLTGTSPKILPIHTIGENVFDVKNIALALVVSEYNQLIQSYIEKEKIQ